MTPKTARSGHLGRVDCRQPHAGAVGASEDVAVVQLLFVPRISGVHAPPGFTDYKTRLQEKAQALRRETPKYKVIGELGPDHDKYFEVMVTISGKIYAREGGRSKKEAEQRAAESALYLLEDERVEG